MTLAALWAFLAVALPVLGALLANLPTVDLAYHLRAGEIILTTGTIPTTDSFTYTVNGLPWLNQQWGAQLILAGTYQAAGWGGLVVLRAALVGLFAGLVFLACRRQGVTVRTAALLTLATFAVSAVALALRPQLIGMTLFALVVVLVLERHRHPRLVWTVPLVVLVWANIHGSFFLGPVVLAFAWLSDIHDAKPGPHRLLAVAGVAGVAASVTPFGPAVWAYAAGLSTNPAVTARITEWQPTSLRTAPGAAFFGSALVLAAFLARRGRPVRWPALLWFATFFVVGAYAVRGLAWWPAAAAIGAAGVLGMGFMASENGARKVTSSARGREAPSMRGAERRGMPRVNATVAAAIVLVCVVLLPFWRPHDRRLDAPAAVVGTAPPGITAKLREISQPGDRLWNPQPWSSWFEYALPEVPVAVDSRFELFDAAVWDDYDAVAAGAPEWQAVLDRWGVTLLVVTDQREAGLLAHLRAASDWTLVHEDADGYLFVRSSRGS